MRPVDPSRLDLAREFRADPLGAHSAELEDLLRIMRWMPATGRFLSVQPEAGGAWYLAYCGGGKGTSLDIYADSPYQSQSDAAWAVFRMRWEALCGEVLQLGGDDPDPRSGQVIRSADWVAERILGYSDRFSVEQGGRIEFKVSSPCSGEYQAKIVRLRCGDHANIGMRSIDVPTSTAGAYPSRHQPVHAGSYVELPSAAWPTGDFTFQCSIWPTLPGDSEQALMANWDASAGLGYALILDQDGAVALRIGDGEEVRTVSTGTPTLPRHWYQVVASFDATNKTVRVAQRAITRYAADPTSAAVCEAVNIAPSDGPGLRIAAWHASAAPCHHCATLLAGGYYNGKLEAPMAAACALSAEDVDGLMARGSLHTLANLQGHWDFSRDIDNTKIVDVSPHQRHGEAVNLPTRAMKGRHWDGSEYNWSHKPEHYGAIHFHDDDLYDAGWDTDFSFDVPTDLASGLYCAHLTCGEAQDWIPFVVRPPTGTAQAPLAVVLPSASYWAYANRHTVIDFPGREQVRVSFTAADASGLYLHHHPELGLSMYDDHSDGSG
ncbi:MAG: hypothetical protein HOI95_20690, partial [Chromatiales bacterium]|nr:hypothetical protein [Chromatiales bacterium]